MNKLFKNCSRTFLFICFLNGLYSQSIDKFTLQITSIDSIENNIILKKELSKKINSKNDVFIEIDRVILSLKKDGFYTISKDSIVSKKKNYTVYLNLGARITKAVIKIIDASNFELIDKYFVIKNNFIEIEINKLPDLLKNISLGMMNRGKSFSKTKLLNTKIKKNILYADLYIEKSKKRTIDSVIVKGYDNFPDKYLKFFYNFRKKPVFNKKKLIYISEQTKLLKFATELKPPEILFSKDSTILYMYLKKIKSNNFDGLINFSSKGDKKGISFNGYLDLNLVNTFNFGEELSVNWKNTGQGKQLLNLNTKIPYLFNTKIISEASFGIYRNDSTFINTKTKVQFSLPINYKISAGLIYKFETSKNLSTQINTENILDFDKNSVGIQLNYNSFYRNKFSLKIETYFAKRKTLTENTPQFRINLNSSILLKLNNRINIFLNNNTAYMYSKNYLQNELYRIGGANSIRGFNEQSIFTSAYSFVNSEFRISTQDKSYIYSIFDFGSVKNLNLRKNLFGFGLGYLFTKKYNILNISYVIGKSSNSPLDINASKITIRIITVF